MVYRVSEGHVNMYSCQKSYGRLISCHNAKDDDEINGILLFSDYI